MDLQTVDHLLTTTRSVRRRLDFSRPVPLDLIERCLEIALQAPTGSNSQGWHWIVITEAPKRKALADVYRAVFEAYAKRAPKAYDEDDPRRDQASRVRSSAVWLAEHMHEAPVHVVPCIEGRVETQTAGTQAALYGSILPAVWSFMLALRARGLGTAWTTLHLHREQEAAEILGIPQTITQAALLPVAYFTGDDFKLAKRLPLERVTHWNGWGGKR
jgi:nitroreductase